MILFHNISGKDIPEYIVSKGWSYNKMWPLLKPILFLSGEYTYQLIENKNDHYSYNHQLEVSDK